MRNRFQSATPLKQLEDVLQEEWYKIPLEAAQNLRSPFQKGMRLYWRQKAVQHHINKEMCTVSVALVLYFSIL
jgi:hypothetical protein